MANDACSFFISIQIQIEVARICGRTIQLSPASFKNILLRKRSKPPEPMDVLLATATRLSVRELSDRGTFDQGFDSTLPVAFGST